LLSVLSMSMRRCCFTSRSLTPSKIACPNSIWINSTGKLTRTRCTNFSTAVANSCY
jgi:hypothetical protein